MSEARACHAVGSGLRRRLEAGEFAVTAEIGPPRGPDGDAVRRTAEGLRGWVDAVNVTDNQGAHVRMASWAASLLARDAGVEPVMQLTCRDRNRIALQSDLIAAAAVGIANVVLLTGDHPSAGDHPGAAPVFDVDSVQLLWIASLMRDEGRLLSGRPLRPAPSWFVGAVENPAAPPAALRADRLGKKVAAGARFVQTQYVFDVDTFAAWMARVRDLGLHERCYILPGVGPVRSRRALNYLDGKVPGVSVPEPVRRRLEAVPDDRFADEGLRLCAETITRLRDIPGVAGVHIMAPGYEHGIPALLSQAGLPPRPPLPTGAGDPGTAAGPCIPAYGQVPAVAGGGASSDGVDGGRVPGEGGGAAEAPAEAGGGDGETPGGPVPRPTRAGRGLGDTVGGRMEGRR